MLGKSKSSWSYILDVTLMSVVFWLIFSLIGLCLAKYSVLEFDRTFSLNAIANTILALFIAIMLPRSLGKALENKKNAKNLLVGKCAKLQESLEKLSEFIEERNGKKVEPKSVDRISAMLIPAIGNKVNSLKTNLEKEFPNFNCERLNDAFDEFRSLITDDLRSKNFTFSNKYKASVKEATFNFERELERFTFEVNSL